MRILLIEDDARLAEHTAEYLRGHEARVDIVTDGETGLQAALDGSFDLVLLDLMLPGLDGLELCRRLRRESGVPIIMLTAKGEEVDRVVGLELGADDYLAKPFSPRELLARIRAVLRRGDRDGAPATQSVTIGPLEIDRDRRTVVANGHPLQLTAYQFELLWVLAEAAERVLSRQEIHKRIRELRGEPPGDFDPSVDRSIDVHLSKVRQALGKAMPGGDRMIHTVRGVGYVLETG